MVQAGDTIYSIAWRFGETYQQLAAYNHLVAPYTVFPGQSLRLSKKRSSVAKTPEPVRKVNAVKPTSVENAPPKAVEPVVKATGTGSLPWPVKGKVIGQFGQNGNKGIDIAVPVGTKVKAVDSGTVVYAGSNLHGYGQLVIIKHNTDLMTAYAHNSQLLVKEGGKVTAGQVIALSGDSDSAQAMVHFELRQAGRPKNPLNFLN